jgi:dihydroflavonol-4-reductase
MGLDAEIVHPSGIIGPFEPSKGHITQMLVTFCEHAHRGVDGRILHSDVPDVAEGILSAARPRKVRGDCYFFQQRYTVKGPV